MRIMIVEVWRMVWDSGGHLSWGRGRREITSVSSQVPPCLYSSMNLDTGKYL